MTLFARRGFSSAPVVCLFLWLFCLLPRSPVLCWAVDSRVSGGDTNATGIVERGPHHRVVVRDLPVQQPDGSWTQVRTRHVELASGMHRRVNGRWVESRAVVEKSGRGAVARHGAHQVSFGPDLAVEGAIEVRTPEGQRLRSHVLGLAYHDPGTGATVLLAEPRSTTGRVVPPNQVVYADALDGLKADVRYTCTLAGLEQDVILLETPPPPATYGLDPDRTQLEVWTEFVEAPEPRVYAPLRQAVGGAAVDDDPQAGEDALDEMISFGDMALTAGRAFAVGGAAQGTTPADDPAGLVVEKSWRRVEGRRFLIEGVPYREARPRLQRLGLPEASAAAVPRRDVSRDLALLGCSPLLAGDAGAMELASAPYEPTGFVMDYLQVNTGQDFTFASGTTYHVVGNVYLSGTTTVQSGAVVKYARGSSLGISGQLRCETGAGPAWFVAETDNSVGEQLVPGTPVGQKATVALQLYHLDDSTELRNLEVRNASVGVFLYAPGQVHTLRGCRFVDCGVGVGASAGQVNLFDTTFCGVPTRVATTDGAQAAQTGSRVACSRCAADDHGDAVPRATALAPGIPVAGRLDCDGDVDFFRIPATTRGDLAIYSTGEADTRAELFDAAGNLLASDADSGPGRNFGLSLDASPGDWYLAVSSEPGTTGGRDYVVQAIHTPPPPGQVAGSLVNRMHLRAGASLRNDFTGWVGFKFQVGRQALRVTELGRYVLPGNQQNHRVRITDAAGVDVPGASVVVQTAGVTPGQFAYATLPNPVILPAGSVCGLLSEEVAGGDLWYNHPDCSLEVHPGTLALGPAWIQSLRVSGFAPGLPRESYGPVDLRHNLALPLDSDGDELFDSWERQYFGNLSATATADPDQDGLSNLEEFQAGTSPIDADSDDDGCLDGPERLAGTHPLDPDSDDDGLTDGQEIARKTDPLKADTDEDGLPDGEEVGRGTDPVTWDSDDDGLADGFEVRTSRTDPLLEDSDADAVRDLDEAGTDGIPWYARQAWDREVVAYTTRPAAAEGGGTGEVVLRLPTPAPAGGVPVRLRLSGNAAVGHDYTLTPAGPTVTIPAGASMIRLTVTAVNDTEFAGWRRVVDIHPSEAGQYPVNQHPARVSLQDNDLPAVRVLGLPAMIDEPRDGVADLPVAFTFIREGDAGTTLVQYFTVSGTAQSGTDYQKLPGAVTFAAGQAAVDLPVTLLKDLLDEPGETITVTLKQPTGYQVHPERGSATIEIRENGIPPLPTVTLTATDPDAREAGENPAVFTVSRDAVSPEALRVHYRVSSEDGVFGVTGGRGYQDYEALDGVAIIPPDRKSTTITLRPTQDANVEEAERVNLTLAGMPHYLVGTPNRATALIDDDDLVTYGWYVIRAAIYGPAVGKYIPARLALVRTGSVLAQKSFPVTYRVRDASGGILPASYAQLSPLPGGNIVLPVGHSRTVLEVKVLHAAVASVEVTAGTASTKVPCWGPDRLVSLLPRDSEAQERVPSNTASFIIRRAANGKALEVPLYFTGLAHFPADFTLSPYPAVIPEGQSDLIVTLKPVSDAASEAWEDVLVRIGAGSPDHAIVLNHPASGSTDARESHVVLHLKDYGVTTPRPEPDSDLDGLLDKYEAAYGLNPLVVDDTTADPDRDGLDHLQEQQAGTDPGKSDTDGNGRNDGLQSFYGNGPVTLEGTTQVRISASRVRQRTPDGNCYTCHGLTVSIDGRTLTASPAHPLTEHLVVLPRGASYNVRIGVDGITDPAQIVGPYTLMIQGADNEDLAFLSDPKSILGGRKTATTDLLTAPVTLGLPEMALALDVDGDGVTSPTGRGDQTSPESPFRFWVNDDRDVGDDATAHDEEPVATKDSSTEAIDSLRDLEDFARLNLRIRGTTLDQLTAPGRRGRLTMSSELGYPGFRVFPAADRTGGIGYLISPTTARLQKGKRSLGTLSTSSPVDIPSDQWERLGGGEYLLPLVFEGTGSGLASLTFSFVDTTGPTGIDAEPVWIETAPCTELYAHWTVGDNTLTQADDIRALPGETLDSGVLGPVRSPASKDFVLLVHGWRMKPWERRAFASTAFKRLWHLGYRGRFGLFSWPTDYLDLESAWTTLPHVALDAQNYDRSERRAWSSGAALTALAVQLRREHPGRVRLLAHSMGNVVVAESLRLATDMNAGSLYHTYLAMQAAIPAGCYDADAPTRSIDSISLSHDSGTHDLYRHFWPPSDPETGPERLRRRPYCEGVKYVGRVANMFNPFDYALARWNWNQDLKPDHGWLYDAGMMFFRVRTLGMLLLGRERLDVMGNRHEIMAHISEARSHPLGAVPDVRGLFDVRQGGVHVNLAGELGLRDGEHEHSAQFNGCYHATSVFWNWVLEIGSLK